MPRALWVDVVRDTFGNPIPGATIEVRDPGGGSPTATPLYVSYAGPEQWTQPLVANAQGCVWFYTAAPGTFDLAVAAAGYTPQLVPAVQTRVTAALDPGLVPILAPSGPTHAPGLVPDPGATPGTTRFLREDATWAALLETTAQPANRLLAGPPSGAPALPTFRALDLADLPAYPALPAARVVQTAAQSLAPNAWTTLVWGAAEYGVGLVNLATGRFTALRAGLYSVSGGALVAGMQPGERAVLSVWRGAAEALRLYDGRAGGAGDVGAYGSGDLPVNAGEELTLQVYLQTAAARTTYAGGPYTWWAVTLRWRE
jgi:hypothetical protein